jgi:HSP20 family protein
MKTLSLRPLSNNAPRFSSLIENFFTDDVPAIFNNEWYRTSPLVNIKDTNDSYLIEMAAPGFNKENFSVKVEDNILTISATQNEEKQTEGEKYTRKEFHYQTFSRSFTLPKKTDSAKIAATYENGILKVTLPKPEEEKPKGALEIKIA